MAEVPVKFESDGSWITSKLEITDAHIALKAPYNFDVPYRSIIDLTQKGQILTVVATLEKGEESVFRIASVEKILVPLRKKILMSCNAYRIMAHFMIPAIRGGVLVTNAKWEKGAVTVLKSGIWFVGQEKQICVLLEDVANLELTKRELQKKKLDVIKLDYLDKNASSEVVSSFILCPLSTLQVLFNFIRDATKDKDMKGSELQQLDAQAAQVAMLIYSGMDTHSIEEMLTLSPKDLDDIYATLLKLEVAEVVMVRREVQLTSKGVRYISEALKPPS
ncbi:MAG: hypothetical protein FWF19_05700 [Euryarchaeota archaeon]|nr:hypothetical protein [Euryarchaeota archaeon]